MKSKLPLTFFLSILYLIVSSQTKFDDGFKIGFKFGYCQDQGVSCIAPIPPVAPVPNVNEDINSSLDGYNRGFIVGQNALKRDLGTTSGNL